MPREATTNRLIVGIGLCGALLFGGFVPLVLVWSDAELFNVYREGVLKSSLNVATGCLLSVVVATLVERHRARAARKAGNQIQRQTLIGRLLGVHDEVKSASLLIAAHKTARTYGEQMRRLMSLRISLLEVRRMAHPSHGLFDDESERKRFETNVNVVADYIKELTVEYAGQYQRISRIQAYCHEWDLARAKRAATSESPPQPSQMQSTTIAWDELQGPAFERLAILLQDGDTHVAEFSKPLREAIDLLTELNGRDA